jgi:hypothetical protein
VMPSPPVLSCLDSLNLEGTSVTRESLTETHAPPLSA